MDKKSAQFDLIGRVVTHLNQNGFFVWHQPNNGRFDADHAVGLLTELVLTLRNCKTSQAQVKQAVEAVIAKSWRRVPHARKGVADIIGVHVATGKFVALEVKIGSDRLSDDQRDFLQAIRESGGRATVIESYTQFLSLFKPRGESAPG